MTPLTFPPAAAIVSDTVVGQDIAMAGSGSLTISGLAFRPGVVLVYAVRQSDEPISWGSCDAGLKNQCLYRVGGGNTFDINTSYSFMAMTSAGNYFRGSITQFNSDGFVFTYAKVGGPPGITVRFDFLCLK